jgi:hypothetical protein
MSKERLQNCTPSGASNASFKPRVRWVGRTKDLPDEWLEALENAKVPDEYAYLHEELKDWKPQE